MTTENAKKIRITWSNFYEVLGNVTPQEQEKIDALKTLGTTAGRVKDFILADRKQAERIAKKAAEKAERDKKILEDRKKFEEKLKEFKEIVRKMKETEKIDKPFKFINTDVYPSFKNRTWIAESIREIQGELYVCCLEFTKKGNFDLPCYIPLNDFNEGFNCIQINCYYDDDVPFMEYQLIGTIDNLEEELN